MKKKHFKLTDQQKHELKLATVNYFQSLTTKPLGAAADDLMKPDALVPRLRESGVYLLEPDSIMNEAHFLNSGLAILFTIDPGTGQLKVLYIWEPESIIMLVDEFLDRLRNTEYYIQLTEDSETVSISNTCMDYISDKHPVFNQLTRKIQSLKSKKSRLHKDILLMLDKKFRYCELKKKFPGLFVDGECRLSNVHVCGFLGISETTLIDARKICPDE
ncbi:MAG TPA: hypothetical protein VKB19_12220 [Pedobacter sp.]|nr:hypothetical protein [Pedobacter sp.]